MHNLVRLENIEMAIRNLRTAREQLRGAGADKAADYVARAMKSAEGALRHAKRLHGEAMRECVACGESEARGLGAKWPDHCEPCASQQ